MFREIHGDFSHGVCGLANKSGLCTISAARRPLLRMPICLRAASVVCESFISFADPRILVSGL